MNEKNLDYLNNQLKYTGFGEEKMQELKEKMQQSPSVFMLVHQAQFGKDNTIANLYFRRSSESDMYFFNKYELSLKKDNQNDDLKQTFYMKNREDNITLKEAYNLMNGRSVYKELSNKEGQKYNAWLQLDFRETDKNGNYQLKQFHQNYGFDLEKSVNQLPIKEMANAQEKEVLLKSLERGNRQSVTFNQNGQEQKIFIEAAPKFKSINIYDSDFKRINLQTLTDKNGPKQTASAEVKKEQQKQDNEPADIPEASQKKRKGKKQTL